jgi:hypothetical protein
MNGWEKCWWTSAKAVVRTSNVGSSTYYKKLFATSHATVRSWIDQFASLHQQRVTAEAQAVDDRNGDVSEDVDESN